MSAPVLVIGYGNLARGDDALGPAFVERLGAVESEAIERGELELLADDQLQVEHALDLVGRKRVVFVDASADAGPDVLVRRVMAQRDASFTTHVLSPQAVLHTYALVECSEPPDAFLIAIRGERFELGEDMSATARRNLEAALHLYEERWGPP